MGKRAWTKVNGAPQFWNARDKSGLRCISGRDNYGKLFDPSLIYASESFGWEMWSHKMPTTPASLPQLKRYVERILPGSEKLCGIRFPMANLLRDCFYNADITFLTAAWLYSSVVSNDVFPCGLRQWPPPMGPPPVGPPPMVPPPMPPPMGPPPMASSSSSSMATANG